MTKRQKAAGWMVEFVGGREYEPTKERADNLVDWLERNGYRNIRGPIALVERDEE